MATYLDGILAWHRDRLAHDDRDLDELTAAAQAMRPTRDFAGALASRRAAGEIAVIAEVKRRSPSRGELAMELDPATIARRYEEGGAACLSVLTDAPHFSGSLGDLRAARAAVTLPVLRKDFTVGALDVVESRLVGADALLLIVAALEDDELAQLLTLARSLGIAALVEVHDEDEVGRALTAGAEVIGVNQRDLRTFAVDPSRAVRVARAIPAGPLKVAESGIRTPGDVATLRDAGYDAILVGEALVTSGDPVSSVASLRIPGGG